MWRRAASMKCWIARQLGTIVSSVAGARLINPHTSRFGEWLCMRNERVALETKRSRHAPCAAPKTNRHARKTMRTHRLPSIWRTLGYKYLFASTWRACDKSFVLLTSQPPNTFYCVLAEWRDELHAYFQPPRVLIGAILELYSGLLWTPARICTRT